MTADYIKKQEFLHILAALMPVNRLIMEVCLATGLRLSDVLNLRTAGLSQRMTVRELKTGKNRRVRIPTELLERMTSVSGKIWVFENRLDYLKPRSRQAVYKDVKRAAFLFRIPAKLQISPHSARKVYAVYKFQSARSMKAVQELLNHSDEAITRIYAMADVLTARKLGISVEDDKS